MNQSERFESLYHGKQTGTNRAELKAFGKEVLLLFGGAGLLAIGFAHLIPSITVAEKIMSLAVIGIGGWMFFSSQSVKEFATS